MCCTNGLLSYDVDSWSLLVTCLQRLINDRLLSKLLISHGLQMISRFHPENPEKTMTLDGHSLPYKMPMPVIKPGPQKWETSALTTVLPRPLSLQEDDSKFKLICNSKLLAQTSSRKQHENGPGTINGTLPLWLAINLQLVNYQSLFCCN